MEALVQSISVALQPPAYLPVFQVVSSSPENCILRHTLGLHGRKDGLRNIIFMNLIDDAPIRCHGFDTISLIPRHEAVIKQRPYPLLVIDGLTCCLVRAKLFRDPQVLSVKEEAA